MKQKTLRKDAHSAQGKMVAEATAPRRENVPGHILFYRKSGCAGACRRAVAAHSIKGKDREKT